MSRTFELLAEQARTMEATRAPSESDLAEDRLWGAIHSCARRLHVAAWSCDAVAPTVTAFVDDLRSGYSTFDMPVDSLRDAALAAGELVAICMLKQWSITEALEKVHVRDQLFHDCGLGK